jgi:hypothetical protein
MMMMVLALVALLLLSSRLSPDEEKRNSKASTYRDGRYGFTIEAPRFNEVQKGGTVTPVMLIGPAEEGFASSANVVVERTSTTRADYRKLSLEQFRAVGFKVTSDRDVTVGGREGILMEFDGRQQGRDLRFLTLAVMDKDRVFVVTCTAPKELYEKYEASFRASIESFRIEE